MLTGNSVGSNEGGGMRCNRYGIAMTGVAVVIGVLTVACGNGSATTPPLSPPEHSAGKATSCTVISSAEASAALGQGVKGPVRGKAVVEGGVACVFNGPGVPPGADPDIPQADTVRVVLVTGQKARLYFDDYRGRIHAQPISGLGDAAYYDGFASVSVLKGNAYVRIAVGIANNFRADRTLAANALARM